MNVTIDAGNTLIKAGFFKDGQLTVIKTYESPVALIAALEKENVGSIIVSSVNQSTEEWKHSLSPLGTKVILLDYQLPVPLKILYKTPQTLGMDRLSAVVGAMTLYPGENCLVIDAGTCITYDFVDKDKNYHGGSISPGPLIRFRSLHAFTSRLPLLELEDYIHDAEIALIGMDTFTAIKSGVINGIIAEVESIISRYHAQFGNLRTLICGGDAKYFESKIKQPIFAIPELIHYGLNRILEHNNES